MKAIFINMVVMVVFFSSSICSASIPAYKETVQMEKEVYLHTEIDQAQEDYNEFVRMRRLSKEDLAKVTNGEEFYYQIVKRFDEVKGYAELFRQETHVIVVFEDVPESIWEEALQFFEHNNRISVVPVMYVPQSKEMLPIVRMEQDGTVEYLADPSMNTEVIEAFCFILY